MPYKNKADRNHAAEYQLQLKRGEGPKRKVRAQARAIYDKAGIDRTGKDIDHKKVLSKGGTNAKSNLQLTEPSANRSFKRNSDHTVKKNTPYPKAKRNPVQH